MSSQDMISAKLKSDILPYYLKSQIQSSHQLPSHITSQPHLQLSFLHLHNHYKQLNNHVPHSPTRRRNSKLQKRPVENSAPILKAKSDFIATFDPSKAIQPGSKLPHFTLPSASGTSVSSSSLLAKGPILMTFYRGSWCPYCNLTLRSLQAHLPALRAKSCTLVAISPELPDTSLSTVEKNELQFPVLSDVGNELARKLGMVFEQPEELRAVFDRFGHDLRGRNGDDSMVVPVPAVVLVGGDGVVRNVHVDADYTKRLEPDVAVAWLDAL
ncbi:putative peroxiredoxin [Lachnellula occidentalis]|uniref:thioredoxin-dependent peroxiredoxin n=1 Tax=Lachnellula occidentalis TaxID=215460 RepID=A0A8H8RCW2_9HELO|nr:putative peroxiredoxin [Lachnellula occidentalis]